MGMKKKFTKSDEDSEIVPESNFSLNNRPEGGTFFEQSTPNARSSVNNRKSLNEYLAKRNMLNHFGRHQFLSADGKYIYHLSIIDYLQNWNTSKKVENFAKKWVLGKDGRLISAVEPQWYGRRFKDFMFRNVLRNTL